MSGLVDFLSRLQSPGHAYFETPGSRKTILVTSHAPWTGQVAYALLQLGWNVLVTEPWSVYWEDERRLLALDRAFGRWVEALRRFNVQIILGGNSTAMLPHPRTRELLHRAAGVPVIHWWRADPRSLPPMTHAGVSPHDYLNALRDPRTLNAVWDADICEELGQFLSLENVIHLPMAVAPPLWKGKAVPLGERPVKVCLVEDEEHPDPPREIDPQVKKWACQLARLKGADLDRSMAECVQTLGGPGEQRGSSQRRPYVLGASLKQEFDRWAMLSWQLRSQLRESAIQAVADRLGTDLLIGGSAWENVGLMPLGFDGKPLAVSKDLYAAAQAALCPLGRGSHAGVSAQAFEIAASNGLLLTQYNRELPQLFEPDKECLAFRDIDELHSQVDRLQTHLNEFSNLISAGHRRALQHHTWQCRLQSLLKIAQERFSLPR